MSIDPGRVRAVFRKEVLQFRRNRAIVVTMGILPVLFLAGPMINIFSLSASASGSNVRGVTGSVLLLMLIVPVILPAAFAAYSVVGERDQGTLEPLLTTPVRRGELMLGKGLAAVIPAVAVTYVLYAVFVVAVRLWAVHAVFTDLWQAPADPRRGPVRAAARHLVGLCRHGDLGTLDRRARRPAALDARQPATARPGDPDHLPRDRADGALGSGDRPRLRPARLPRLLGRRVDAGPRAPDRRPAHAAP